MNCDRVNVSMTIESLVHELKMRLAPYPRGRVFDGFRLSDYLGTPREVYQIPTPEVRKLAQTFLRSYQDLTQDEWLELLDVLYRGPTYTDRQIASNLLGLNRTLRQHLDLTHLERWLVGLAGWCEIDNLCQANFSAAEMLSRWPEWKKLLNRLMKSKYVSQRRASLVLLTRPVRESTDERLAVLAFTHIEKLEPERAILITKAISWLLRELIKHHRPRVALYLKNHRATLPKIAGREVSRKLATGKK